MKAEEAKRITNNYPIAKKEDKFKQAMESIYENIKKRAESGFCFYDFPSGLTHDIQRIRNQLKEDGYSFYETKTFYYNVMIISW